MTGAVFGVALAVIGAGPVGWAVAAEAEGPPPPPPSMARQRHRELFERFIRDEYSHKHSLRTHDRPADLSGRRCEPDDTFC